MNGNMQRTFVYLRQTAGGRESGYARAERQERSVRINMVVQGFAPGQTAHAFAVTEDGILYLGPMRADARGQGGVVANLSLREYRAAQVLFAALSAQEGLKIPLAGTLGRSGQVDWEKVSRLAQEMLQPKTQEAKEQPEEETEPAEPEQAPRTPEKTEEAAGEAEEEEEKEELYDLPAQEEPFEAAERELRTPLPQEKRVELPALLRNAYWPQFLWPLHDLFERFEEAKPAGARADAAYIRIPLGGKYGTVGHYLVGACVRDGWVTGIGYLIPGSAQERPKGLADYSWENGYWQSWQYAEEEN